jgi:methylthioribulose-1-phosphate dehydratase
MSESFAQIASNLASIARGFHARGWVTGTSGNLSAVVDREPLRLARVLSDHQVRPSDESFLHIRIVKERGAGAVFHTHSIWNTILSDLHAPDGGLAIEGYEMLKGLEGVRTHAHRERVPIIENSQDMPALADSIGDTLRQHQHAHGLLLRRHGLYSWGNDLPQARRHIEILEFLLEAVGRTSSMKGPV